MEGVAVGTIATILALLMLTRLSVRVLIVSGNSWNSDAERSIHG